MSFFDTLKEQALITTKKVATEAAMGAMKKVTINTALNTLSGVTVTLTDDQLNALAAKIIVDDPNLTGLHITCSPGAITIQGMAKLAGVPITYSTQLALESCEITPTRKVLTLRRLDQVELGGNGFASAMFARVVKVLVCGLFGIDPAKLALNGAAGIAVDKDRIIADLDKMDATEAILNAMKSRMPDYAKVMVDFVGNVINARIGVDDIVIGEGLISGKLHIHSAVAD